MQGMEEIINKIVQEVKSETKNNAISWRNFKSTVTGFDTEVLNKVFDIVLRKVESEGIKIY